MGRYVAYLGEYSGEADTLADMSPSSFSPPTNGRLVGIRAIPNREAATALINHVMFELTCSLWTPNKIEVGTQGSGLQTAPAMQAGPMDWDVDQPVQTGSPISLRGKNITSDTPVTVSALLYGIFDGG